MIDMWSPEPLVEQLARELRRKVDSGEWVAGKRIPSEVALSQTYGVARGTVRQALGLLRAEGRVVTLGSRGSFVPPDFEPPAGDYFG